MFEWYRPRVVNSWKCNCWQIACRLHYMWLYTSGGIMLAHINDLKDERRMATTEMRMVRWAMGVSLLEHRRNGEILEEAKVEQIATVVRRRRLEWFGHVKIRDETENIRAVVEMKMEGKRPRGRPKLRWKDTVRRDLKAWRIREEWATDRERWRSLCKTRYRAQGDGGER